MDSDIVFDWDDGNRRHIANHQVTPQEAEQVIKNDCLDIHAETRNGEERITSIGPTVKGRFLVVITTFRGTRLRVVTAFPAPKTLIDLYFTHMGG